MNFCNRMRIEILLLILIALLTIGAANADTIPGPWVLYNGTAIVKPRVDHPTLELCAAQAKALGVIKTYTCRSIAQVVVQPDATDPVDPDSDMGQPPAVSKPIAAAPAPRLDAQTILRVKQYVGSQPPAQSAIGSFRVPCGYSHMAFDDPIVFPGQAGKSHLHTIFGNMSTNAFSTTESLLAAKKSTCSGGIANQSAYWKPALIDTKTNQALTPIEAVIYYKKGSNNLTNAEIQPPPNGLRMVAGRSATATTPPVRNEDFLARTDCDDSGSWWGTVKPCPAGSKLVVELSFPNCWDGVNLDSPDHRSHMRSTAEFSDRRCPKSHPVPIPTITMNAAYIVREGENASQYRFASDQYDVTKPGGYSLHGDAWIAWDEEIKATWMKNCINAGMDCHARLLGDGRTLY